jgi:hypothetical protein
MEFNEALAARFGLLSLSVESVSVPRDAAVSAFGMKSRMW